MEETQTQEAPRSELLSWWEGLSFPGKEKFSLSETGTLNVTQDGKERSIATLTEATREASYRQLSEKYKELEDKVSELGKEWETAEDKTKLAGRVERLRENIAHAHAIGDLDSLQSKVGAWDKELQVVMDANYELKKKLAEKAESLADIENFKEGTQAYRELVDEWKTVGFTDKQRSDELWARIEAAKDKFHERKRQFSEELEKDMLRNLDVKLELVEQAEALSNSEEWKKTAELYKELFEKWKATGPTMHEKNEELWARFNAAKGNFFDRKRAHGEEIHKELEENYAKKEALVAKAEELKESTDWSKTTQAMAELTEEWKKIGRVAKEKSDEIWARFNAAKDVFFGAKKAHYETMHTELDNNLLQKRALVERAQALKNSVNWRDATDEMIELMEEWKSIGAVPHKLKDEIWEEFNSARKHFFARKDEHRNKQRKYAEQKQGQRMVDTHNFVAKLKAELADDEARIEEFREGLNNITPGKKEKELREHLTNLISEIEASLPAKREKIEKVQAELEEMEKKNAEQ